MRPWVHYLGHAIHALKSTLTVDCVGDVIQAHNHLASHE